MITLGSWWVNKRTGQKMSVAPRGMLNHSRRVFHPKTKRYGSVRFGLGRNPDRIACYLEGTGLYLAWLAEDELRAAWRPLRVSKDDGPIPHWVRKPRMNDFLYTPPDDQIPYRPFEPYWVNVQRICSGWLCLTGMVQSEVTGVKYKRNSDGFDFDGNFDWGLQAYNTFFLPASKVVSRLTPKFEKIQKTVYDHINEGGALGFED